jgi:hypothetical protein
MASIYGLLVALTVLGTTSFAGAPSAGPAAVAADETWTIPGAGSTAGLNNTRFVSDLAVSNPGTAAANVTISFVGPGGLPARSITVAAGATTAYRDVLGSLWSATGLVGAISVHSDQPLVLRARTYNTATTGTFGVALPVYASGQLLEEGGTADSLWVQQDPSGTSGFRTNVGVVFPDASGGEAVVTFYDATGVVVGSQTFAAASAGFQQVGVAATLPAGLLIGRAEISVTRGRAAAYAVGVDNVTGDTSLYPFEALPAGVQDVVVNGVARLNGRNNTFFRTDARFYNSTGADATVTVRFHAAGASNPTPQSATLNVPAGRVHEVVDVLGTILNAPVGSGGAVRFTSDRPIAVLCRTSNVDPQGVQPGTFGAQQRPVPLASFLSSADAGAVVTAIRQDASFRTNVGFTAGPDGADYRLTLKSAQGASITSTTAALGPFGWAQPNVADIFAGTAIPADATLLVEVTSGTVDVYDASLDNTSGDLVVTPIAALPVTVPASAVIGPSGGSIRSADGHLTLKVPAGALAAPATLSISPSSNTAPQAIGSGYALSPVGVAFARPARLVLAYSVADIDGTGAGALGLASQDGSSWFGILGGSVDTVARTLSVPVSSTSPGPQPARAGHFPASASANGNLGVYGSVKLSPRGAVVPVRGEKAFALSFVGPSSTQSTALGFVLLATGGLAANVDTSWYANGVILGNGREGTIFPSGTHITADYSAPLCKPPLNPVRIAVRVDLLGSAATTWVQARVRVIEKDWRIDVAYTVDSSCSGSPPPAPAWSVGFTRGHNGAFRLDEQSQVVDFLAGLTRPSLTSASAWCPGFGQFCTQPSLSPIGDLNLNDLRGTLFGDEPGPYWSFALDTEVPGAGAFVSYTCSTGGPPVPFQIPIIHGPQTDIVAAFDVPFGPNRVTLEIILPATRETIEVTLTPIPPSGCP